MLISGERVRQARELKGLTQKNLAVKVGVTQAAIAQIEGGSFIASDDLAAEIARATEQPITFFLQDPAPEFPVGSLLFRAHAAMGKREATEAYRHAQLVYEAMVKLRQNARSIPVKIPVLSNATPVTAAQEARKQFGLLAADPIPHLLNILEWNGVLALVIPDVKSRDAFSLWFADSPILALSANRPGDRLRLSLAHELGHLIMHKGKSRFEVDDSEADQFAAEFLMPEYAMRREISSPVTLSSLAALKPRWRVSIQALIRRAKDLGLITDRQYRYLFEQLSAMGWRLKEPVDILPEKPRALRQMAEMNYGTPPDYDRIAHDLSLSVSYVRNLLGHYAGKEEGQRPMPSGNVVSLRRKDN